MTYCERAAPPELHALVECGWVSTGPAAAGRVLPDGCMDLIRMDDTILVAGPDTAAFVTAGSPDTVQGLRFRPGVLPRLLGVPAAELRNARVPLAELRNVGHDRSLVQLAVALAAEVPRTQTAPWSLPELTRVTGRLAAGAPISETAHDAGWSNRTLQRHCTAVYGYGPVTLRRILRFRRAVRLLEAGLAPAIVAAHTGYADQPHLHREVRSLAGVGVRQLSSAANRSTVVPSGSSTVA